MICAKPPSDDRAPSASGACTLASQEPQKSRSRHVVASTEARAASSLDTAVVSWEATMTRSGMCAFIAWTLTKLSRSTALSPGYEGTLLIMRWVVSQSRWRTSGSCQ